MMTLSADQILQESDGDGSEAQQFVMEGLDARGRIIPQVRYSGTLDEQFA